MTERLLLGLLSIVLAWILHGRYALEQPWIAFIPIVALCIPFIAVFNSCTAFIAVFGSCTAAGVWRAYTVDTVLSLYNTTHSIWLNTIIIAVGPLDYCVNLIRLSIAAVAWGIGRIVMP